MNIMITYTVRREELTEHLALVGEVYADLQQLAPHGLGYVTYQLDDDVSFVELLAGDAGPGPLAGSAAFARFRSSLDARCERPPVLTELRQLGAYPAAAAASAPAQGEARRAWRW